MNDGNLFKNLPNLRMDSLVQDGGKMCVVRFTDDTAGMAKCSEGFEHIWMVAPGN